MPDFWIIIGSERGAHPVKHRRLVMAEAERDRLAAKVPDKTFRIYRCKTHIAPGPRYERMRELLARIAPSELARIEGELDHQVLDLDTEGPRDGALD